MNRPEAKNAISTRFLDQFHNHLHALRYDPSIRVLILRSTVDRVFCAGADLKERAGMSPLEVKQFLAHLRATFRDLETLPFPTIAALDGAALGGGLEMALSCDLRVAGPGAKVGLPETRLAILPGAGGTQRLPRIIGMTRAKELIYTAKVLGPDGAKEYGIVNRVGENGYEIFLDLAKEMLPQGPIAMRMAKLALDKASHLDIDTALEFEQACYAQVIPTKDRLEGLRAFKEKRTPQYRGE
ncbi:MAG: ClpP/crotonase-like domain-containing protein [Piptocephalis tieghemiana]|nr:MAG: ClpP/crotonase-like domain-containing protein [Piptocephalis tieghemiana]